MPGLIRGIARTAVVAGTATAVSNRVSRRQAGRWAAQDEIAEPVYAPPAPQPSDMDAVLSQIKELGRLKESGLLSDVEFQQQKDRILQG